MSSTARSDVSVPMTKMYCTLESHIDVETNFTTSLHCSCRLCPVYLCHIVLVVVQWLASVTADRVVTDRCVDSGHQAS